MSIVSVWRRTSSLGSCRHALIVGMYFSTRNVYLFEVECKGKWRESGEKVNKSGENKVKVDEK